MRTNRAARARLAFLLLGALFLAVGPATPLAVGNAPGPRNLMRRPVPLRTEARPARPERAGILAGGVASVAGVTEYYVPGEETHILAAFQDVGSEQGTPNYFNALGPIHSRVSIVASADDTTITVDRDDDGYEPGFPGANDGVYTLDEGQVLTFQGDSGSPPYLDSGDRIRVVGGGVSVVRMAWADTPGPFLAGAWELHPTVRWDDRYQVPVGEDQCIDMNGNLVCDSGDFYPMQYVYLFVQAEQNNTRIRVSGYPDQIVNAGVSRMYYDVPYGTIITGTNATTGAPQRVQAQLITAARVRYNADFFTVTPHELLGMDYYIPTPSQRFDQGEYPGGRPGGDWSSPPGIGTNQDSPVQVYIYALEDTTDVSMYTSGFGDWTFGPMLQGEWGSIAMPLLPSDENTGPYQMWVRATGGRIAVFTAGDDASETTQNYLGDLDYGAQVLNESLLGDEYYLPFAPGNPLHITPVYADTTVFVDWDNDGWGDGAFNFATGWETLELYAPTADAGRAHLLGDGPFSVIYGQDNSEWTPGEVGVLPGGPTNDIDFGYTIQPPVVGTPVLSIEKTANPVILPPGGGSTQFTLVVRTHSLPVYDVDVSDVLPPGWAYVPGTTQITYSDGTPPSTADPVISGATLTWDLNHDIAANQSITVVFRAQTVGGYDEISDNLGEAVGYSGNGETGDVFRPRDHAYVYVPPDPRIDLEKYSSAGGQFTPGQTIAYTLVVRNTGTEDLRNIVVTDPLPANTTFVANSIVVRGPIPYPQSFAYLEDFATGALDDWPAGSQPWAGPWIENFDDGVGTTGNLDGGWFGGTRHQRFREDNTDPAAPFTDRQFSLQRTVNLTCAAQGGRPESATLQFDYNLTRLEAADPFTETVTLEVLGGYDPVEGAMTWRPLAIFNGVNGDTVSDNPAVSHYGPVDISSYIAHNTTLRWRQNDWRFGGSTDIFRLDNVRIDLVCRIPNVTTTNYTGRVPPTLVRAADGYALAPGETLTITYQVVAADPWPGGVPGITNTAVVNAVGADTGTPVADEDTVFDEFGPTAVRLARFEGTAAGGVVVLVWETASERDNVGFYLYRGATAEAPGERVNTALIPSRAPGGGEGAAYEYLDAAAGPGVAYYWLEDVDVNGARTRHGPVMVGLWRAYLPVTSR